MYDSAPEVDGLEGGSRLYRPLEANSCEGCFSSLAATESFFFSLDSFYVQKLKKGVDGC